jgi:hypothetical protein
MGLGPSHPRPITLLILPAREQACSLPPRRPFGPDVQSTRFSVPGQSTRFSVPGQSPRFSVPGQSPRFSVPV